MKIIIGFIFFLLVSLECGAQEVYRDSSNISSKILKDISYFWKIDSLGQNGYRLCNYKRILQSNLDGVTLDFLLEKLGKPNFMTKDNSGTYYSYYYFNGRIIPKNAGFSEELMFISFKVNVASSFVNYIFQGAQDD